MSASKYDPNKLKRFEEYVALGMTKENSAVMAFGIDRATYYRWMGDESTLSDDEKSDFLRAMENGRSQLNNRLTLYILKGAADDGKLALDYLKRLESETYGDSSKLVGDKDNPLRVNHTFSDEQLKRILSKPTEDKDRGNDPEV